MKAVEELIDKHYRRETQKWYRDEYTKTQECTPEEANVYKAQVSRLRFIEQMDQEEKFVMDELRKGKKVDQSNIRFWELAPLVSRRKHVNLWPRIGKIINDGSLFTFKPTEYVYTCGCSDSSIEDIAQAMQMSSAEVRNMHEDVLARDLEKAPCDNPIKNPLWQAKHTIGNWNCKACLNTGTEINTAEDAAAALGTRKALEWCPRFFPLLRQLPLTEYIAAVKDNKVCYGGLVHSEMSFEESDDKDTNVHYVVIKKKCDTCSYEDVIMKVYYQPEAVKADTVLQVMP